MYANPTPDTPSVVKAPYFEAIARSFVSEFGDDALRMIDITIEGIAKSGQSSALEIWRDIRLTLLRKSASIPNTLLQ